MNIIIVLHILLLIRSQDACRFAPLYTADQIFNNATARQSFLRQAVTWEAKFIKQVAVDNVSGMTYDGQRLDYDSGELLPNQKHLFTASSKQCIHVAIIAKVLEGDAKAQLIYTVDEAIQIIAKKVNTYESFNHRYPGFGGFMPWVSLSGPQVEPTWDFKTRTPALDNGQLFWAAYALSAIWAQNFPTLNQSLRLRWDSITWKLMIKNARKLFFNETTRKIRAVVNIRNISDTVENNVYSNNDAYYLDDPYEGQMFIVALDLFSPDFTTQQINDIWVDKRKMLQSANYTVKSLNKIITAEKGFWFSAHQQWKNLFLPYYASQTYWRIFTNGEKIRTWNSADKKIPGFYASMTGTANKNTDNLDYFSDCGIPEIAFQKVAHLQQVTPYGSFPLFLASPAHAAVWYHNMLMSPSAQTKYGSLEATNITGYNISPMLTWDTKITTVLAMSGGVTKIIENSLKSQGLLITLVNRLEIEYGIAFRNAVGFEANYTLPTVTVLKGKPDFTTCQ